MNYDAGINASDNATTSASGADSAVKVCLLDCQSKADALLVFDRPVTPKSLSGYGRHLEQMMHHSRFGLLKTRTGQRSVTCT